MAPLRLDPPPSQQVLQLANGRVLSSAFRTQFTNAVVDWHARHSLDVSWRKSHDPYRILVSEMLLQRTPYTRVRTVLADLFDAWPTIDALAAADEVRLKEILRPLGLVYRSQALVECARAVRDRFDSCVPTAEHDLISLPGVGNYVARAVRCVAFGHEGSALDGGIGRLLRRITGSNNPVEINYDRELWTIAAWLSKRATCGRGYFFGILDLGRDVCTRNPKCEQCPLTHICLTYSTRG